MFSRGRCTGRFMTSRYVKEVSFFNKRHTKGVHFLLKWYTQKCEWFFLRAEPTCTTFCRVPHPEYSLIGRVKRTCVGEGEEDEAALQDEFGIRVTVQSCFGKLLVEKIFRRFPFIWFCGSCKI